MSEEIDKFNENVEQLSERLSELIDVVSSLSSSLSPNINDTKNSLNSLSSSLDSTGKALKLKDRLEQEQAEKQKNRNDALFSAVDNSKMAVAKFADAVISSEPGFKKFGGALDSTGEALIDFAKQLPMGNVFSFTIKAVTELGKVFLDQADAQNNFVTEVYRMGGLTGQSSQELVSLAREARYSAEDLAKLAPILKSSSEAMTTLGGTTGEGVTSMLEMFAMSSEVRDQYHRLGYSLEELNSVQASYIELQRQSGVNLRARNVDEDRLKKRTLEYVDSLTVLSDLTGKSAETLQQEQLAAQTAYENVIANRKDEAEIRRLQSELANETNQERREALQREINEIERSGETRNRAIGEVANTFGKDFAEQFGKVLRTGAFDESTKGLAVLGLSAGELQKRFEGLEANSPEFDEAMAEFAQEVRQKQDEGILNFSDAIQFGGEELGRILGLAKESIMEGAKVDPEDELARREAVRATVEETKKSGDAQRDLAAAITSASADARASIDGLINSLNPLTGQADTLGSKIEPLTESFQELLGVINDFTGNIGNMSSFLSENIDKMKNIGITLAAMMAVRAVPVAGIATAGAVVARGASSIFSKGASTAASTGTRAAATLGSNAVTSAVAGSTVSNAARTATSAAGTTRWDAFIRFVSRKSPSLLTKLGPRLAAMAGMAAIPGPGWIAALISLGLNISLAWQLYSLWKEFSGSSEDTTSETVEQETINTTSNSSPHVEPVTTRIQEQGNENYTTVDNINNILDNFSKNTVSNYNTTLASEINQIPSINNLSIENKDTDTINNEVQPIRNQATDLLSTNSNKTLEEIMNMVVQRLDDVIYRLENSNEIQSTILMRTSV